MIIISKILKLLLNGKSISKYLLIFLATIASKSISVSATSDLNLSDHNYEPIHKHQYESHRSGPGGGSTPVSQQSYQWFYNSNDNSNHMNVGSDEQPTALTQIDRFFSTGRFSGSAGISGHFPFDYHQNGRHSRHSFGPIVSQMPVIPVMPSIPSIPPIPPVPQLIRPNIHLSYPSSTYLVGRDGHKIYRHKNNYNKNNYQNYGKNRNNDYNHEIKHYTTHDNRDNHIYRSYHFMQKSDHSYHRSYDSGAPTYDSTPNHFWIKTFEPNLSPDFGQKYEQDLHRQSEQPRVRTRREHFSRRTSFDEQMFPKIDEQMVKNNDFYKELQFSWNFEQNKRF